jgi:protease PrsW
MPEPSVAAKAVYLECIAGKDYHRHFLISPQPVMMAHASLNPQQAVKELTEGQGFLLVQQQGGTVIFDATNCQVPVYLNNQETKKGELKEFDFLRVGSSIWRVTQQSTTVKSSAGALKGTFNGILGLEELHDFKLGNIFSEVFKKHTSEEMEEQLVTGTASHTPYLDSVEIGWGKPWLFARLLGISVVLAALLYAGFMMFDNDNLVPGLIFVGSFAVPVSTLIFFLEMNVTRNVSIFMLMQMLFVGGVASLLVALVFYSKFDFFETYLGASAAGIIEETAKILIVILLVGKSTRYPWILNGLLFGAAVGTGFGAFESAGYAFRIILSDGMIAGVDNIILRGVLAPFMHVVWTANVGAALWMVKKDKPFKWDMLKEGAFLRILIAMMVAHMLWNAPFSLMQLPLGIDLKNVILGVLEWMICFRLIQAGLQQLKAARQQQLQAAKET